MAGDRRVHVMVAITYRKGIILAIPYQKMNGPYFASFIKDHFNITFAKAGAKHCGSCIFVMDNDPSQTSKVAMEALRTIEANLLEIPARSPDLNPIEQFFTFTEVFLSIFGSCYARQILDRLLCCSLPLVIYIR